MALIDFIDVSSDEVIDLSSDDEPTREDRSVCGQGHAADKQEQLCHPTVFTTTDEGSQQDLETGNAAEAASFLVTENEGVGTATSLNFHQSSTARPSPCKEYRVASQTAAHGPISTSPKARTPEAPSTTWRSPRLKKMHEDNHNKSVLDLAVEPKSFPSPCQKSTSGRRKRKDKSQQKNKMGSSSAETSSSKRGCSLLVDSPFSEAPIMTWRSPRLKKKHEGKYYRSMLDLAVELQSSHLPYQKTTSGRRMRKDKSQQKNKMHSSILETSPSKRGCSLLVDSPFSEADAVAAQAEEVDPTGSLVVNP